MFHVLYCRIYIVLFTLCRSKTAYFKILVIVKSLFYIDFLNVITIILVPPFIVDVFDLFVV